MKYRLVWFVAYTDFVNEEACKGQSRLSEAAGTFKKTVHYPRLVIIFGVWSVTIEIAAIFEEASIDRL